MLLLFIYFFFQCLNFPSIYGLNYVAWSILLGFPSPFLYHIYCFLTFLNRFFLFFPFLSPLPFPLLDFFLLFFLFLPFLSPLLFLLLTFLFYSLFLSMIFLSLFISYRSCLWFSLPVSFPSLSSSVASFSFINKSISISYFFFFVILHLFSSPSLFPFSFSSSQFSDHWLPLSSYFLTYNYSVIYASYAINRTINGWWKNVEKLYYLRNKGYVSGFIPSELIN